MLVIITTMVAKAMVVNWSSVMVDIHNPPRALVWARTRHQIALVLVLTTRKCQLFTIPSVIPHPIIIIITKVGITINKL